MAKKHYVVEGEGDDRHLASVKGAEFASNGTKVLRIVMANGDEHLINFGSLEGARFLKDGVLVISTSAIDGVGLRSYRDWSYYEEVPYKVPVPARVHAF
ncbi:hypothetical protein ACQEVI_09865 [Promicromonospora sp. CA-289599]|uniref:hypothetical protein n=1 Tax=Promicromonospora sp. CA-289599 TaxID=3240014 RepID=UPI003D93D98F